MSTTLSKYFNKPLPPEMISEITLTTGNHAKRGTELCIQELVAWLAGKPHSDVPPCVCPAIRAYTIKLNDRGPQWLRDALRDRALKLVDTQSSVALQKARVRIFVAAAIRSTEEVLPIFEKRFPNDDRPRKAIQVARDVLAGKIERIEQEVRSYADAAYAHAAIAAAAIAAHTTIAIAAAHTAYAVAADDAAAAAAHAAIAAYAVAAAIAAAAHAAAEPIWLRHLDALDAALALTDKDLS